MKKSQLALTISGVALIILIFQLPQVVVENEQLQEIDSGITEESHSFSIPSAVNQRISGLKDSLVQSGDTEKKIKFALTLANIYLDYGMPDSAVFYGDLVNAWLPKPEAVVADVYFRAYEQTQITEQRRFFAEKANKIYEVLLDKDSANLFLKNRLAMTLVVTDNPMAGIMMLREIIASDPENREAILNLGLLSIQSGQYERAKKRFEKLIALNPSDHEAKLYLAVTLIERADSDQARSILNEILMTKDSIPAIKAMVGDYLNAL